MADGTHRMQNTTRKLKLGEFVQREVPHLRVASMSQPEPEFARHNVVAATRDIEVARAAVLDLEALEADDARLGLVVLSASGDADVVGAGADPEGVTGMVASRTLVGGGLGALAGALLVGAVTTLFTDASIPTAAVAAFGGAAIGGVFGAICVVFAGMGGSDAYRQSFIAPELTDVCIVSLHTDDPGEATKGRDRLVGSEWITIVDVDGNGNRGGTDPPNG